MELETQICEQMGLWGQKEKRRLRIWREKVSLNRELNWLKINAGENRWEERKGGKNLWVYIEIWEVGCQGMGPL